MYLVILNMLETINFYCAAQRNVTFLGAEEYFHYLIIIIIINYYFIVFPNDGKFCLLVEAFMTCFQQNIAHDINF